MGLQCAFHFLEESPFTRKLMQQVEEVKEGEESGVDGGAIAKVLLKSPRVWEEQAFHLQT